MVLLDDPWRSIFYASCAVNEGTKQNYSSSQNTLGFSTAEEGIEGGGRKWRQPLLQELEPDPLNKSLNIQYINGYHWQHLGQEQVILSNTAITAVQNRYIAELEYSKAKYDVLQYIVPLYYFNSRKDPQMCHDLAITCLENRWKG